MTDTLYIRLGSQQHHIVHWLIWSTAEQRVVEQGELLSANETDLSTLKSKATSNKVVVFVPGSDVNLKALKVPGNSARAIRLAAPYMLEDGLAQDVEQLFFAYGDVPSDKNGNNCFVAAVEELQIEQWQAWLNDAGISTKVMMPDVLALPAIAEQPIENQQNWSAVGLDDQILVRQSAWQAVVVDKSFWRVVTKTWVAQSEVNETFLNIHTHSDLPLIQGATIADMSEPSVDSVEFGVHIHVKSKQSSGLACLAEHCPSKPVLNLLQGKFKATQKRSLALTHWFWVGGFVAAALLLNIIFKVTELSVKQNQVESIEKQIIKTYKKAFPRTKKVRINTIKSQMKNKMKGIGSGSGSDHFLPMLTNLQPAFSLVPDLSVESMKFDGKKKEIRLQVAGSSYELFEKFTTAIEKMGMKVKQGAQNNKDGLITGSFSITGARR